MEFPNNPNETYKKFYKNKFKTYKIKDVYLYPVADIKFKLPLKFNQNKCDYTTLGRELLEFEYLQADIINEINIMRNNVNENNSIEYFDNRISRYSMQMGKCSILGTFQTAENIHCHHILPKYLGGKDNFRNLVILNSDIHRLIHAVDIEVIKRYIKNLNLNYDKIRKINKYRKRCNLESIKIK